VSRRGASIVNVIISRMNWRAGKFVPGRNNFTSVLLTRLLVAAIFALAFSCTNIEARQASPASAEKFKQEAHASIANGQWDAAIQSYEKAIALAPNDLSLRLELGAVLLKSGQLTDSIAAFQEALRIAPHNLTAELGLAQGYRAVRNNEEAKRVLERAIREHPKSPEPLAAIGEFEIQQQTYDAAIGHLKASLALAPANAETRNLLAAAYKAKGDLPSALAELGKVLARDPNNALAHFLRAEIYSDQNKDALALPDAQKVVALQPQNLRGRTILGKILLRTPEGASQGEISKRCSEAVAALEPIAESEAQAKTASSETLFLLSRAYRCAGQAEQAEKTAAEFESASQQERSAKENEAQANHLVQQANDAALTNDFQGAVNLLQQALAKDPNSGAAYSILAKLYYSAGDLDKASEAISEALVRGPHHPDFLYVQGKILEKQGKSDEALASFEQTTLINPRESDAYFEMGAIYQQRNDRPRAIAAYKKAVEISPDDPDYRKALASVSGAKPVSP
jgi:tetratricopeptide (TPR) repeat protein